MKKILFAVIVSLTLASCGTNENKNNEDYDAQAAIKRIEKLEAELISPKNKALNFGAAQKVVEEYKDYAKQLPLDSKTPEYLFKAADVEMGLQNYLKAETLYNRIYDNYGNYEKRVMCLYLTAFINDNHLDRKGKAKEIYEKVIERHPEHQLAQDAIASLDLLTLSDEELIKFLKEKNQQTTDSIQ